MFSKFLKGKSENQRSEKELTLRGKRKNIPWSGSRLIRQPDLFNPGCSNQSELPGTSQQQAACVPFPNVPPPIVEEHPRHQRGDFAQEVPPRPGSQNQLTQYLSTKKAEPPLKEKPAVTNATSMFSMFSNFLLDSISSDSDDGIELADGTLAAVTIQPRTPADFIPNVVIIKVPDQLRSKGGPRHTIATADRRIPGNSHLPGDAILDKMYPNLPKVTPFEKPKVEQDITPKRIKHSNAIAQSSLTKEIHHQKAKLRFDSMQEKLIDKGIQEIIINKHPRDPRLGFGVVGGVGGISGNPIDKDDDGIYVSWVNRSSPAGLDRRLKPGMKIIKVNDICLLNVTCLDAIQAMRKCSTMRLIVCQRCNDRTGLLCPSQEERNQKEARAKAEDDDDEDWDDEDWEEDDEEN